MRGPGPDWKNMRKRYRREKKRERKGHVKERAVRLSGLRGSHVPTDCVHMHSINNETFE
jgi:hypothetical protein